MNIFKLCNHISNWLFLIAFIFSDTSVVEVIFGYITQIKTTVSIHYEILLPYEFSVLGH